MARRVIVHNYFAATTTDAGPSVEKERDGTWSIFFAGNPHATRGGFPSEAAARAWLAKNGDRRRAADVTSTGKWHVKLMAPGRYPLRVTVSALTAAEANEKAESANPGWKASKQHTFSASDEKKHRSEDAGSAAYEAANRKMNAAQAKYDEAVRKYRAREIDDKTYLAARAEYTKAQAEFDVAFAKAAGW